MPKCMAMCCIVAYRLSQMKQSKICEIQNKYMVIEGLKMKTLPKKIICCVICHCSCTHISDYMIEVCHTPG